MLQMVGRGMRAVEGKSRCVFIDLRGVTRRRYHKGPRKGHLVLGLPEDDRSWSLAGRVHDVADADAERALHTCPACEATVGTWSTDQEGWRTCPACRTRLKAPTINAQVVARDLEAFGSAVPEAERLQALRAEAKKAARLGYKPGYVAHRYLERFGVWPPFGAADAAFTDAVRDRARPPTPRRKSKAAIEAELAEHGDAWEGDDGE
jgi:hypothetical protein